MILVLNLGLKSVRAIVFDRDGRKRASAARTVQTRLQGAWIEQDPEEWWTLALEVMGECLADGEIRSSLTAVTVTSSSCCLVCVDETGRTLRPAIMVSDHRAVSEAEALGASSAFQEAADDNGNLVSEASLMLPKIMWLRQHNAEVFERSTGFLGSNDFLIQRLSGELVTDPLNAEKLGYSVSAGRYTAPLLAECGVEEHRLPRVVPQGTIIDQLKPEVMGALGLDKTRSVKVVVTTYDAICAFFGSGSTQDGDACDVSGTVTSLRVLSAQPASSAGRGIYSQFEAQSGCHIVGGSNNLGGGLIEWAKQSLYPDDTDPYERMERDAAKTAIGADGVIFLPYLLGERAPLWDLDVRGLFFGLERRHQRHHLIRAVFEAAAYSLVFLREAIESTGCRMNRLRVSGGLARVGLISQIKADVFGTEVEVVEEFETTSVGAFILSAMALEWRASLEEAAKVVRVGQRLQPSPDCRDRYDDLVDFYQDLYRSTKPLFEKRRSLMKSLHGSASLAIDNL